ncbi:DsbA family oxidoreductase [Peribacillus sp. FSL H8-0477]|uniref:DsbA family oxidoreductase n=1 Tax=Peribacillus sp. FSL H8-0477 TaxID=2921388 RepID=UPI0030F9D880
MFQLKVEIWSDYQCPFCYIGKRRFEKALEQFDHKSDVEVVFRSFELDPNAKRDNKVNMYEMLAGKYGMSLEQAKAQTDSILQQAKAEGLEYRFDKMILTNSFDAHRLLHFAADYGKEKEMNELLFKAYFTNTLHIGRQEVLTALAAEAGLDPIETKVMLESDRYTSEVRADEQEGSKLGITGVPFFVIDRKYGVSGAQPTELFINTLKKAWEEDELQLISGNESEGGSCTDDSCTNE